MAGNSPCASCKLLRRKCSKDCIFAPYFPSNDPQKSALVHKVFGASNVSKMLQDLPVDKRGDAVSSLVYEAHARVETLCMVVLEPYPICKTRFLSFKCSLQWLKQRYSASRCNRSR